MVFCIDNMNVGGTELNAIRTAERLDPTRFELSVVCLRPDGPLRERYERAGIPVIALPTGRLYSPRAIAQGLRLARHLRASRTQIVHCHDAYTSIFATVFARLAGVPAVIASRRTWKSPHLGRGFWLTSRYAYRLANVVLANSPAVAALVRRENRLPDSHVAVVPNFADREAFAPLGDAQRIALRRELGIPDDALTVGVIARLTPVKDHATLLRAVARLAARVPRLHVVLVGDGPARGALEAQAAAAGLAHRVHFAGMRPNTPNLHGLFDVSALTSVTEAFPNSIVEAMAAGRPVVATRVGGNVDAVREDATGFLVPVGDDAELAAALGRLLDDAALRSRLGAEAARVAREVYDADRVIGSLTALYDRLLAGGGRSAATSGSAAEPGGGDRALEPKRVGAAASKRPA